MDLISRVAGKRYFSFAQTARPDLLSRPINRAFFEADGAVIEGLWQAWAAGDDLNPGVIGKLAYTVVMAYCAASELFEPRSPAGTSPPARPISKGSPRQSARVKKPPRQSLS
jgi:hypothetical protein